MTKVVEGCAKLPPPNKSKPPRPTIGNPENCPEGLLCFTEKNFNIITDALRHLKNLERWAKNTWEACRE